MAFYARMEEEATARACENCAREDPADDLVAVRRVYVVPESWDTPGPASSTTVEPVELWCFSCRSQYPHEPTDAGGDEGPGGPE
ncbi:MAG: hypothetical protein ACYDAD_12955 [Acidimicrobiales bacterium]